MNPRLAHLAQRRERLQNQAAAERAELARHLDSWRTPLGIADQGLATLRFIRRHPAWVAAGGLLITVLRPSRGVKWLRTGWMAWRILRKLRCA